MLEKFYGEFDVGERWRSRARTITETDLVLFAAFSGDWYPLHTDAEWVKHTQFGQRIAHGLAVLSISSGLWILKPGSLDAFYGIDKLRWIRPTFIGDTIHVESEVLSIEEKNPRQAIVTYKSDVLNQKDEVVMASTVKFLMTRRAE